jgi:3-deoxy-D-manno-octulosonate 8-phosphate phosphatase (KDO 8-P phosphatase)
VTGGVGTTGRLPGHDADLAARARALRFLSLDVDGVLTDGRLYYTDGGEELKAYSVLDGLGIKLLQEAGVEVALVTGRSSRNVVLRAANLGVARVLQGVSDKLAATDAIRAGLGLDWSVCGHMGDDLPDLALMLRCGFSATVPAAPEYVRSRARYVTRAGGGEGAVREVADYVLHAKGLLSAAIARHAG